MSSSTSKSTLDNLMEATFPENLSLDKQFLIRSQLIKGRFFANQLLSLLRNPIDRSSGSIVAVEELVANILTSFTDTISMLNEATASGHVGSPCSGDVMSPRVPVASRKRPAPKNEKRGTYKRKTADPRNKVSPTMEDGYLWRKYGQKEILNCKQPRCYFRCTHKHGQGCKAIKQVQKLEDDPNLYKITYYGYHTCTNSPNKPINMFQDIQSQNTGVLSFESNDIHSTKDEKQSQLSYPTIAASASTSVNGEGEEESKAQSETSESENVFSAQSTFLNETTPFGLLDNEIEPTNGFDHADFLCYDPYEGLDFPMMRHTDFGADLQFDDIDFQ